MKKGMRLLAALSAAVLLLSGCGTQLYEMTDEEEDLIVQGAAYMLSKHNIFQKDGMNGILPQEKKEEPAQTGEENSGEQPPDDQEAESGSSPGGSSGAQTSGGTISLEASIGYKDTLKVTYDGYSLMDVYQEGTYFSLSADSGKTFVVMRFTIRNLMDQDIEINNYDAGYAFYCILEGVSRVPEKQSFIANSLASYEGKIAAGKTSEAVLVFEITKEQAELLSEPALIMEQNGISYSIIL